MFFAVDDRAGLGFSGEIWNQAGALWDIQCDQPLAAESSTERFHNAGVFQKSAGTGTTTVSVSLNNSGAVRAESGTIQFTGDYSSSFQRILLFQSAARRPAAGMARSVFLHRYR
jgi:hypothetical protein